MVVLFKLSLLIDFFMMIIFYLLEIQMNLRVHKLLVDYLTTVQLQAEQVAGAPEGQPFVSGGMHTTGALDPLPPPTI